MRKLLFFVIALLLPAYVYAEEVTVDGIKYEIGIIPWKNYAPYAKVAHRDEYSGKVVIPEKIVWQNKTYPVTGMKSDCFEDCESLTAVVLPDGIEVIGAGAFQNCINLTSVRFPKGLKAIDCSAFEGCLGFSTFEIPNTVVEIESSAFKNCRNLTSIRIPDGVKELSGSTFEGCLNLTSVTLPEGMTVIEGRAFRGCTGLESINIPSTVKSIGEYNQEIKGETNVEIISVIA